MSSIKNNIIANYISQIYVAMIGIVTVPIYVKYMGAEAYGLVGFFAMMQAWFQLLDIGLTPTMSRESARWSGGATDALALRRLLRALEVFFVGVGALGAIALFVSADIIGREWLKVQHLTFEEVRIAVILMGMIIACRWMSGLYRGTIIGLERLVWLSGFNIIFATLRFVLVVPILIYIGSSPRLFFEYQLIVAVIELILLWIKTYKILPVVTSEVRSRWQWQPLKPLLKFSLSIAFTSMVWVMVTQIDKLILSKMLLLSDYAYFTLAVMMAGGVLVVSGPIGVALMPRLAKLNAENDELGVVRLYRKATQLIGVLAIPPALVLVFFAEHVIWVWTGDPAIAGKAAPVLALYAIGNGILALAAFPYYLQFAKGDLRMHLLGNVIFVALFIPLLLWATMMHGMVGAGYAWVVANFLPFIAWVPVVHMRLVKGLHRKWLLIDVLPVVIVPIIIGTIIQQSIVFPSSRYLVALALVSIGITLTASAVVSSSWARGLALLKWHAIRKYKES